MSPLRLTYGHRRIIFTLCLLVFVLPLTGAGARGTSLPELLAREALPRTRTGLTAWAKQDQEYLGRFGQRYSGKQELQILWDELNRLLARTDYRDELGFIVYTPETSGQIYLIASAINVRLNPAAGYPWGRLMGHEIVWEEPQNHPKLSRVVETLRALKMPSSAFVGYRVFLLPFSLGGAGGYGGNGYALLAAAPAGQTLIANQLEVTLAHEFGHHLHARYMDRTTENGQRLWDKYLELRGISWQDPGEVNTAQWGASSEEVFAEDFRVWAGGSTAAKAGYFGDLAYPAPKDITGQSLRKFFRALSGQRAKSTELTIPWVSPQTSYGQPSVFAAWVILGAVFGQVMVRTSKKRPFSATFPC